MGFLDTPWVDDAPPAPEGSSFTRGLRSGMTGSKGQLTALVGSGAEALGMTDYAANRYARAKEFAAQAQAEAPPVTSYRDVHDLRSGFDYVSGLAGQAIPMAVPAVGAALLTKRPILGPTAVMAPFEAGDIIQRQNANPETASRPISERLPTALSGGAASALVQSVAPGGTAERIVGKTAAKAVTRPLARAAESVGETALTGGAGAAGGEAIKEVASDQPLDPHAVLEAGVGGAVGGAAMGIPGAIAEGAHGRALAAGKSLKEVAEGAVSKGREALAAGKEKAQVKYDDLFNREARQDEDTPRAVALDEMVRPLEDGEDPKAGVARSDAAATEWVNAKLREMMDESNVSDEHKEKLTSFLDRVHDPVARAEVAAMDIAKRTKDTATKLYDHVASGEGIDTVKTKVADAASSIKKYVDDFNTKPITARVNETKAALSGMSMEDASRVASSIGDRAVQMYTAAAAKLREGIAKAKDARDEALGSALKSVLEKTIGALKTAAENHAKGKPTEFDQSIFDTLNKTKKSEDYSGVRQVIADEILPALRDNAPKFMNDEQTVNTAADAIRIYVNRLRSNKKIGEQDTIAMQYLHALLGPKALQILDNVNTRLKTDKAIERNNFYQNLVELKGMSDADREMADFVRSNLKSDKGVRPGDLREAVKMLRSYADGTIMEKLGPAERAYREKEFHDTLRKEFGANVEKVLDRFEREYHDRKEETKIDEGSNDEEDGAGDAATHALEVGEPNVEKPKYYGGKDDRLVLTHEAHKKQFGNDQSQASRLMEQARKENPDRPVRFISAKEYARENNIPPAELHEMTAGKPNDYGIVAAGGDEIVSRITSEEAERMTLDTTNYRNSPSRINTTKTGVTLDAVNVSKVMRRHVPKQEGESGLRHDARVFFDGLGAALTHYGATVKGELKDSLVVAYRNGEPVRFGDIKNMGDFKDPLNTAKKRDEQNSEFDKYTQDELLDMHKTAMAEKDELAAKTRHHLSEDKRDELASIEDRIAERPIAKALAALQKERDALLHSPLAEAKAKYLERIEAELDRRAKQGEAPRDEMETHGDPRGQVHQAVKKLGEDGARIKRDEAGGVIDQERAVIESRPGDKVGEGRPSVKEESVKNQIAQERATLTEAVKDKPLESISITRKLVDGDGNELTWRGKPEDHPGKVNAMEAAKDLNTKREMVKKLLACLKG